METKTKNSLINCGVGILTYNSEKHLPRCLDSLTGFAQIIIADGGSQDGTLAIAQKYHCQIIPQSQLNQPIADFAQERNRLLAIASHDWFFYIDSDEFISPDLKEIIRKICAQADPPFLIYKIRQQNTSPDCQINYRTLKPIYQTRFFNKKSGAYFINKIHERIAFDSTQFPVGVIDAPWYVPLNLQFSVYRQKINSRHSIRTNNWSKPNFFSLLKIWLESIQSIFYQLIKIIYLRVKYNNKEIIPLKYELYRLYSHLVLIKKFTQKYFQSFL